MQSDRVRIVFIGDIIGRYGRKYLKRVLPSIRQTFEPDIVIANGENSAGGLGIITKTAEELFGSGVDFITTGNHIWDKKDAQDLLKREPRIIRPMNFPSDNPGSGYYDYKLDGGLFLTIVNLQGRVFMEPVVDNPFVVVDDFLNENKNKLVFVDFHAEATAEKQALGFFLDGRVSAVVGTHTHVQTADLRILENGTAYQSDVGMTGSVDSVIGMRKEPIVQKFLTGINQRFEVAKGSMILDMTLIDIDARTGKAVNTMYLRLFEEEFEQQLAQVQINR